MPSEPKYAAGDVVAFAPEMAPVTVVAVNHNSQHTLNHYLCRFTCEEGVAEATIEESDLRPVGTPPPMHTPHHRLSRVSAQMAYSDNRLRLRTAAEMLGLDATQKEVLADALYRHKECGVLDFVPPEVRRSVSRLAQATAEASAISMDVLRAVDAVTAAVGVPSPIGQARAHGRRV